jgi:hypothetical protein
MQAQGPTVTLGNPAAYGLCNGANPIGQHQTQGLAKVMLDRKFEEHQANPQAGAEWKEIEPRLRQLIRW